MLWDVGKNVSLFLDRDDTKFLILNTEDVPNAYERVKTGPYQSMIFLPFASEILF